MLAPGESVVARQVGGALRLPAGADWVSETPTLVRKAFPVLVT